MTLSFSLQWETADIMNQYEPAIGHQVYIQHSCPTHLPKASPNFIILHRLQILEAAGNKAIFLVARLKVIAGVNDQAYCRLSLSCESLAMQDYARTCSLTPKI